MNTRFLRGIEVSAIGYGCMGLSYGYGTVPERGESIRLIQSAFDMGCTFFDTPEAYGAGENERIIGEAVKPFRNRIVLATKLHLNKRDGDTAVVIRNHLEASMKRLETDYVDLYYQHRIEDDDMVEEVAGVMGELIQEGKIRGWGQSQATENQIRRANAVTLLTAVQSEFSMMERMYEKDVIPACGELGIGFVPFSPLASGFLSGKYAKEQIYSGDDVRRVITRFAPENVARNQPLLDLLQSLAWDTGFTPAQISLAWMLHKKDYIVPISGMRKQKRMGSGAVAVMDDERDAIRSLFLYNEMITSQTKTDFKKTPYWGYPPDHTRTTTMNGRKWSFSDYNKKGYSVPFAQLVIVEDEEHRPRQEEAKVAWNFFRNFRRDKNGNVTVTFVCRCGYPCILGISCYLL